MVDAWRAELARRPHVRHLGAVLASVLRDPASALPPPTARRPAAAPPPPPLEDEDDPDAEDEPEDEPAPEAEPVLPPGAWERIQERLRERLGPHAADVWLGQARPLAREGRVLVIAVGTPMAADWLTYRLYDVVVEAAEAVLGRRYSLRFVPGGRPSPGGGPAPAIHPSAVSPVQGDAA